MVEKFEVDVDLIKERIIGELRKVQREGIEDLINALLKSDFFIAPASTVYHMNVRGGLAYHSWNVYKLLSHKNKAYGLEIPEETVILTALCHDLCKINCYSKQNKNVKDEKTGRWETKLVYVFNEEMPLGHGECSVIRLQKYVKLTPEEMLMVRWHMGFTIDKDQYRSLNKALEVCPWIGALHTADCESGWFFEFTNS